MKVLGDILTTHAAERGDKVALKFLDRNWTYDAMNARQTRSRMPRWQKALEKAPGSPCWRPMRPFLRTGSSARPKCGVVLVPVNFRLAPLKAFVVDDAEADIFFVDQAHAGLVKQIAPNLKSVKKIIAVDFADDEWSDYESWRNAHGEEACGVAVEEQDTACQMYVRYDRPPEEASEITHHNLLCMLPVATREWGGWNTDDVSLVCMPLFSLPRRRLGHCRVLCRLHQCPACRC